MKIETLKNVLEDEGFRPTIDADGDLLFKYEGKTYFLESPTDDEQYVRIVLPNFWELESEQETAAASEQSIKVTRGVKVVKLFPVKGSMWASAELFLPNEEALRPVLERVLGSISVAARLFAQNMSEFVEASAKV